MRRLLFFVFIFGGVALAAAPLHAQTVQGGVLLGANVATLRASDSGALGYRTAAAGGFFAEVGGAGPLSVRSELLFSQKGATVTTETNNELTLKANYLELPLLVVGQLPFARAYRPHVLAGPALSLKLYERQGGPGFSVDTEQTVFERTDAGMMVGAGASLGGPGALQLEVRYILGVRDVTRSVTTDPLDTLLPESGENGVWSIVARLGF